MGREWTKILRRGVMLRTWLDMMMSQLVDHGSCHLSPHIMSCPFLSSSAGPGPGPQSQLSLQHGLWIKIKTRMNIRWDDDDDVNRMDSHYKLNYCHLFQFNRVPSVDSITLDIPLSLSNGTYCRRGESGESLLLSLARILSVHLMFLELEDHEVQYTEEGKRDKIKTFSLTFSSTAFCVSSHPIALW